MHIGLFFGSFNPIHNGHLIIADFMREYTGFDEVWFVVSPQNPHKPSSILMDDIKRLKWVKHSIADNPKFKVCDIEFTLPKPSYTVHTLAYLQKYNPMDRFSIIMGNDNIEKLHLWKDYQDILNQYTIYVFPRLGYTHNPFAGNTSVIIVPAPILEISSTSIRQLIQEKKSIQYLVPFAIQKEVLENYVLP